MLTEAERDQLYWEALEEEGYLEEPHGPYFIAADSKVTPVADTVYTAKKQATLDRS